MLQERLERFLGRPNMAVLTWVAAAGEPSATPVWYLYRDGKFLVHTMHPTAKTRALGRNPSVCLCVQDPEPPYRYVTVWGEAKLSIGPAAYGLEEELAYRYLGRVGGRYYLRNLVPEMKGEHTQIEITPARVSSLDGSEGINPLALVLMRALRKVPGLG